MHSNAVRKLAVETEPVAPRTPAQVIRLYPPAPQQARARGDTVPAKERLAVGVLVAVTLTLGGTLAVALYQALQNYRVF